MGKKHLQLVCKDCGYEIFVDKNMVMLKNEIWNSICDETEDAICAKCIEKRLGRKITISDFMESRIKNEKMIKCNVYYMKLNKIK